MENIKGNKNVNVLIELAKKDKNAIAIGIFGSFARGERYRDIDVCVFLKPQEYPKEMLSRLRFHFTLPNEKYDVQIFQQLPIYIRKRILKEMKIIYCKDEDALYDLAFKTIREFDDYQHHYEEYLEAVLYD